MFGPLVTRLRWSTTADTDKVNIQGLDPFIGLLPKSLDDSGDTPSTLDFEVIY